MENKIRIGLVGCGRAAELIYLPLLRNIPSIKVAAVIDPIGERRTLLSSKFRDCLGFPVIDRDFLSRIDAAVLSSPPDTHVPLASVLLKHNKYVLVEKPLALTDDGIKELMETERNSQAKLMMGFNHRYWLPAVRLKDKIFEETKLISAQIVFTGDYGKWSPVSFISDPLNDLGPHVFDLIRFIFRRDIISVKADLPGKKSVNVKVRLNCGSIIECHIAHAETTKKSFMISTSGENYFLDLNSERLSPGPGRKRKFLDFKDKVGRKIFHKTSPVKKSFQMQMENFMRIIKSNKTEYAGIEDGLHAILAVLAVNTSAKNNGKEIYLNEIEK